MEAFEWMLGAGPDFGLRILAITATIGAIAGLWLAQKG